MELFQRSIQDNKCEFTRQSLHLSHATCQLLSTVHGIGPKTLKTGTRY